ncbi:MAG: signal peptidase I [Treponema sp.]|jgi:signal peptidase I|nr:signal peptidase I [Treponema sp.]
MFEKRRQYSYKEQKQQRYIFIKFLAGFFFFYLAYNCFSAFLFSVWTLDNNTMKPGLVSGDRLIFTSFSLPSWINIKKSEERPLSFKRGSIVLIDMEHEKKMPLNIIDGLVRFFTAQRLSVFSADRQYYIKRVIGLPEDEITMTGFVFRVRPSGSSFSLTEFELADKPYQPSVPKIPDLWDESIPFSGYMDTIVIGQNECFVVADDRGNTNDSRTWGAIPLSSVTARAVFRFWPPTRIGFL